MATSLITEAFVITGGILLGLSALGSSIRRGLREAAQIWASGQKQASITTVLVEPFGYIHHYVLCDVSGAVVDTTWEADACQDQMPHPKHPEKWKWSSCEPFYTHRASRPAGTAL